MKEQVVANVQTGLSISLPLLLDSAWQNVLFPYLKASHFLAQVNHIPALPTLTSMLKMEAAYSSQNITHARFQTVRVV
jgi:hypothetical protein